MLLQELLFKTDLAHPGYADIERALELVKEAAMHINEEIRTAENRFPKLNLSFST
jgi:hypothetical protein